MADRDTTTDPSSDDVTVVENPGESRFEIFVAGERVGLADYRLAGDRIAFTHTEVDPPEGRKGLGGRLVGHALDEARRRGLQVQPLCPFVRAYIRKRPELHDLVSAEELVALLAE